MSARDRCQNDNLEDECVLGDPRPCAPGQAMERPTSLRLLSYDVSAASYRTTQGCRGMNLDPARPARRLALPDQSSGSRIQPCFMAYTTACVRSLTESLRRMLDMWFLTVCSLMVSA
jgi:hypothetical protein